MKRMTYYILLRIYVRHLYDVMFSSFSKLIHIRELEQKQCISYPIKTFLHCNTHLCLNIFFPSKKILLKLSCSYYNLSLNPTLLSLTHKTSLKTSMFIVGQIIVKGDLFTKHVYTFLKHNYQKHMCLPNLEVYKIFGTSNPPNEKRGHFEGSFCPNINLYLSKVFEGIWSRYCR